MGYSPGVLFDARTARVVTPDGEFEPVRVIFRAGRAAIWDVDLVNLSAVRIAHLVGATFTKRRKASQPHLIGVGEYIWQVYPKVGPCGCGSTNPLKRILYSDLLGDNFTQVP